MPPKIFSNVVFPEPDGPNKTTNPVLGNDKLTIEQHFISGHNYQII